MIKKDHHQLIDEYYNKVKDQYPGVSKEEFIPCCTNPFFYARKEIEGGELPTIRFKYLGALAVYPNRVFKLYDKLQRDFKSLKIEPSLYFEKKALLEKFINKQNDTLKTS